MVEVAQRRVGRGPVRVRVAAAPTAGGDPVVANHVGGGRSQPVLRPLLGAGLLRFRPSQPPPIGPHGRPEPWKVRWEPEDFAAWLRARAAWRDAHGSDTLPQLYARERHAMAAMHGLPAALVNAERSAPNVHPQEWARRSRHTSPQGPYSSITMTGC